MDNKDRSIVAQVCLKTAAEVYTALCDVSQGYQPALMEQIFKDHWRLHDLTMKAVQAPPPGEPGPFDQGQSAPQPVAQQPVPQSQPVAQPSPPQPVMQGPPCPNCGTPTVMTKDYPAKKARNLSQNKKPPPMWKCPLGSWNPGTKQAEGCQGSIWQDEPAVV